MGSKQKSRGSAKEPVDVEVIKRTLELLSQFRKLRQKMETRPDIFREAMVRLDRKMVTKKVELEELLISRGSELPSDLKKRVREVLPDWKATE